MPNFPIIIKFDLNELDLQGVQYQEDRLRKVRKNWVWLIFFIDFVVEIDDKDPEVD